MRNVNIKRNRTGVPILSRDDIDEIGEILVSDFNPDAMIHPQEIDIDLFAQDYLNMDQDFKYLSHCGLYLGMTVFNDTNRVIVYNPEINQAEYISVFQWIVFPTGKSFSIFSLRSEVLPPKLSGSPTRRRSCWRITTTGRKRVL